MVGYFYPGDEENIRVWRGLPGSIYLASAKVRPCFLCLLASGRKGRRHMRRPPSEREKKVQFPPRKMELALLGWIGDAYPGRGTGSPTKGRIRVLWSCHREVTARNGTDVQYTLRDTSSVCWIFSVFGEGEPSAAVGILRSELPSGGRGHLPPGSRSSGFRLPILPARLP